MPATTKQSRGRHAGKPSGLATIEEAETVGTVKASEKNAVVTRGEHAVPAVRAGDWDISIEEEEDEETKKKEGKTSSRTSRGPASSSGDTKAVAKVGSSTSTRGGETERKYYGPTMVRYDDTIATKNKGDDSFTTTKTSAAPAPSSTVAKTLKPDATMRTSSKDTTVKAPSGSGTMTVAQTSSNKTSTAPNLANIPSTANALTLSQPKTQNSNINTSAVAKVPVPATDSNPFALAGPTAALNLDLIKSADDRLLSQRHSRAHQHVATLEDHALAIKELESRKALRAAQTDDAIDEMEARNKLAQAGFGHYSNEIARRDKKGELDEKLHNNQMARRGRMSDVAAAEKIKDFGRMGKVGEAHFAEKNKQLGRAADYNRNMDRHRREMTEQHGRDLDRWDRMSRKEDEMKMRKADRRLEGQKKITEVNDAVYQGNKRAAKQMKEDMERANGMNKRADREGYGGKLEKL